MTFKANLSPDTLGAVASSLCIVHCLATPLLFVVQSCSLSGGCTSAGPFWWQAIDYLFIGITFFAVYQSTRNSTRQWIKYALYANWVILTLLIFNAHFALFPFSEWVKHLTATGLIALHIYNLRYCKCAETACCTTPKRS